MSRPIHEIATEIRQVWPKVHPWAKPYLDAMSEISDINDNYYEDTARSVVIYFLSNAQYWRGADARRIKNELNQLLSINTNTHENTK